MDDRLLHYYERELTYFRELGAEFAQKYPKIANRLELEPDRCEDPHIERLIEAFAYISARIHKKIDDDFPEITESLLGILYPHYVNPIPSMSIVRFDPIKPNISEAGHRIARGTLLYSKPVQGTPCQFRTGQPVTIWPIEVVAAEQQTPRDPASPAQQTIRIELKTFNGLTFSQLDWQYARFFLNGPAHTVFHLYELVFNNVFQVTYESTDKQGKQHAVTLPADTIRPVGLEPGESMLNLPRRSFTGYNLLFEYFCFPERFLFFDLSGLNRIRSIAGHDNLSIWLEMDRLAGTNLVINKDTFLLNASPAVNLFKRVAEPVRVDQHKTEYRVIPDLRRQNATEVYSIDRVKATSTGTKAKDIEYRPFYSIRHHLDTADRFRRDVFWQMQRRTSERPGDNGTDVYLSFRGPDFSFRDPGVEIMTVHTTCTNRGLPERLPFGDPRGDFDLEIEAPISRITSVIKPTPTRRPFLGGNLQWRLISHLALNHISLAEDGEDALREMLRLYDFDNSPSTRQQINGIVAVNTEYATKRIGYSFCRGVQVTVTFDEDNFVGAGIYLFATVLERFLAQYVSVNSFSQLIVKKVQQKEIIKKWPPRNGNRILL